MQILDHPHYTIHDFEAFIAEHPNRKFELVEGEIVEKMPTLQHGVIASRLNARLFIYSEQHQFGRVASEVRHQLPNDDQNARIPDLAFYTDTSKPITPQGALPYLPDLVIEIQSPDDSIKSMRDKADYYLANGSRMVWIIYPEKKFVEVYTLDEIQILNEQDTLDGEEILPNFQLPVADIFASR